MKEIKELTSFYAAIKDDHRIGPTHISVYMALFQLYNLNEFQNPVKITRTLVMERAKISGLGTFHKCIKNLVEFGYIEYLPSFYPAKNSEVVLLVT
jgi:hypothetical protein